VQHINNCQYQQWYHLFKDCAFKTKIIELPHAFVEYLNEDGVFLPGQQSSEDESDLSDVGETLPSAQNSEKKDKNHMKFTALEDEIKAVLEEWNHKVFIKLNWSSAKDASWMVSGLKCENIEDIYMLLKSSEFIAHDLEHSYDECPDQNGVTRPEKVYLIMKKWHCLGQGMEFRCFVKNNALVGISQRDYTSYYDFLKKGKEAFFNIICAFYEKSMKGKFMDSSYVFDIYIDSPPNYRVWLLDINPWSKKTDALLFHWEDLDAIEKVVPGCEPVFKIVEHYGGVKSDPLNKFRVPTDFAENPHSPEIKQFFESLHK